jgi:HEAT repeat protein
MLTTVREKQLSAIALSAIREEGAIPLLVESLKDADAYVRDSAARALGNLGEKAATEKVLDSLVESLKDANAIVRDSAARALVNLGEKATTEKGLLVRILRKDYCPKCAEKIHNEEEIDG